jgi:hypothetical protein
MYHYYLFYYFLQQIQLRYKENTALAYYYTAGFERRAQEFQRLKQVSVR